MLIKGEMIYLLDKKEIGKDEFNRPIYSFNKIPVDNVLYMPTSATEQIEQLNLTGRKIEYTVSIPKGDNHSWENQIIIIKGRRYRVCTSVEETIDHLTPLAWNKKFRVEAYE